MSKLKRFCLVKDDDSHWYLIKADARSKFVRMCESAYENDKFDEFEDEFGLCRIDGPQSLTFTQPALKGAKGDGT